MTPAEHLRRYAVAVVAERLDAAEHAMAQIRTASPDHRGRAVQRALDALLDVQRCQAHLDGVEGVMEGVARWTDARAPRLSVVHLDIPDRKSVV